MTTDDTRTESALWSAQAHMPSIAAGGQVTVVSGDGAYITTSTGQRLLDGAGGLWYANIGHGREEIADAAAEQIRTLETWHLFGRFLNPRAVELADRIAALSPISDPKVAFTSGGSDSIDLALKLARRHWQLQGKPEKRFVLSRDNSYHGLHAFGTSVGGLDFNRDGYGPTTLVPETVRVDHLDIVAVERTIRELGGEKIAAFITEPVMGTGGVVPPPAGYFERLNELAAEFEFLIVADEVITGFGRTGTWFASERYDLDPDIIVFAKGVTSGYQPLGGIIVAAGIWKQFYEGPDAPVFRHGLTYSGHATVAAVALKNLEIIEREGLLDRVRALEPVLARELEELRGLPGVADVRYAGLLGGIDLEGGISGDQIVLHLEERGVHVRNLPRNIIMMSPPFIVTEDELVSIPRLVREALAVQTADRLAPAG